MKRAGIAIGVAIITYLAIALPAGAQPELSFNPVSAALGDTAILKLNVSGADAPYRGVNVKFTLPQGVTVASVEPGELLSGQFTIDSHSSSKDNVNIHAAFAYSLTDSVAAADGTLLLFTLDVSDDPAALGLNGTGILEAEVAFLSSGVAADDFDTSLPHTTANGLITISEVPVPALTVLPVSCTVRSAEGTTSFAVANLGAGTMPWTASVSEGASWLRIASAPGGVDAGAINAAFDANLAGTPRSGSILVDAGDVPGSPAVVTVTQEANRTPVLSVSPETATVSADGGVLDLAVENTGNGIMNWSARVIQGVGWLSVASGAGGTEDGVVSLACLPNGTETSRAGVVEIVAAEAVNSPRLVAITQAPPPVLSVAPLERTIGASACSVEFQVTNRGGGVVNWSAEVVSGVEWLEMASGSSGSGDGALSLSCARNGSGNARSGAVTIHAPGAVGSPVTVQVTQAGDTVPLLSVSPASQTVNADATVAEFTVANVGHGTLRWSTTVLEGGQWLSISAGAAGTDAGVIRLSFSINSTGNDRTALLHVEAEGADGSPVDVALTQRGVAQPVLSVTPLERTLESAACSAQFQVTNQGNGTMTWTAQVMSGVEWLTIASGAAGTGEGTITLSCAKNDGESARSGALRVEAADAVDSPATVQVTQAGNTVPLLSVSPASQTVNAEATTAEFSVSNLGHGTLRWSTTVLEGVEWLSLSAGASGTDTGAIKLYFTPNNAPGERSARLRVEASGADGSPAEVTLVQRGAELIQVTAPNGGESWKRGDPRTITWSVGGAKSVESVSIILLKGGNVVSPIALTTHNTGSYAWTIPPDLEPGDDYKIQVVDVTNPAVHDESDGAFAVNCPPEPPSNVQATNSYHRHVQVTWDAVDTALEYQVYRNTAGLLKDPVLVATVTTPSYEDRDVSPGEWSVYGCCLSYCPNTYTYWIKAANNCDASEFSASADGACSSLIPQDKSRDVRVWEKVLPHPSAEGEEAAVPADATLAIRLRSKEQMDPTTVWADINSSATPKGGVQWLPADTEGTRDGWALIKPNGRWMLGDTVTITAGARTYASSVVGPITYTFRIEPADTEPPQTNETDNLVWQPAYDDLDTSAFDLEREGNAFVTVRINNANGAPPLAGGIGEPYVLSPDQVFEVPQRVWLPVPQGEDLGNVTVQYYYAGADKPGWYPAENVEGWLVPDSLVSAEFGGVTYVGFLVRHGGTVQLGGVPRTAEPDSRSASVVSASRENSGDLAILGLLLLALGGISSARRRIAIIFRNSR